MDDTPGGSFYWLVEPTDSSLPPMMIFLSNDPPEVDPTNLPSTLSVLLLGDNALEQSALAVGAQYDETKSTFIAAALDCDFQPRVGVTFTADHDEGTSPVVYVNNLLPAGPQVDRTSESGTALVYNVPEGDFWIRQVRAETGELISERPVLSRPGFVSWLSEHPLTSRWVADEFAKPSSQ